MIHIMAQFLADALRNAAGEAVTHHDTDRPHHGYPQHTGAVKENLFYIGILDAPVHDHGHKRRLKEIRHRFHSQKKGR